MRYVVFIDIMETIQDAEDEEEVIQKTLEKIEDKHIEIVEV